MCAKRGVRSSFLVWLSLLLLASMTGGMVMGAAEPIALLDGVEVRSSLQGDLGGSYALYEVAYPGGETELEIKLWLSPGDPLTCKAFGFNVYGWNGFQGKGEPNSDGLPQLEFSYGDTEPNTLLVQVYNYHDGCMVSYGITASGVAAPQGPQAASESVPAAEPATDAKQPELLISRASGTSVGNSGGALRFYALDYPGDGNDTVAKLTFFPCDPSIGQAVGFVIYDPTGKVVAEGVPTEGKGEREATFSSDVAGRYLVQVYNYADGMSISYTLEEGHFVDVGGYKLRMSYAGQQGPTVIMEAGMSCSIDDRGWATVQPEIAKFARTISYDRAGLGKSDPGRQPRRIDTMVGELYTMLHNAKIEPPYILVAHSMGGLNIRLYAATYPDEVAGLVFVDASHEDHMIEMEKIVPGTIAGYRDFVENQVPLVFPNKAIQDEARTLEASFDIARQITYWPNVPAVVLTHSKCLPGVECDPADALWLRLHKEWLTHLPQATHVIASQSGHWIQEDEPHLVIDAVHQVVEAASQ